MYQKIRKINLIINLICCLFLVLFIFLIVLNINTIKLFVNDPFKTIQNMNELMSQYLQQEYDGEMSLERVGRSYIFSSNIYGLAHNKNNNISFEVYRTKKSNGLYEFYDTYHEKYITSMLKKRLNNITKEVYKNTYAYGDMYSLNIENDLQKIKNLGINFSLEECKDIIKYKFNYEVSFKVEFNVIEIENMYKLLQLFHAHDLIPSRLYYNFYKNNLYIDIITLSNINEKLISYDDFKELILEQYYSKLASD